MHVRRNVEFNASPTSISGQVLPDGMSDSKGQAFKRSLLAAWPDLPPVDSRLAACCFHAFPACAALFPGNRIGPGETACLHAGNLGTSESVLAVSCHLNCRGGTWYCRSLRETRWQLMWLPTSSRPATPSQRWLPTSCHQPPILLGELALRLLVSASHLWIRYQKETPAP